MTITVSLRDLVWQRAGSRCEYCQMPKQLDPLPLQLDHIIARKHHGPTVEVNLALSCFHCNNHKGPNIAGSDPETGSAVPLFNPRRDRWHEHFRWNGAELVGRTASGKATVDVLGINLPLRRAFREALIDEGLFPPRVE